MSGELLFWICDSSSDSFLSVSKNRTFALLPLSTSILCTSQSWTLRVTTSAPSVLLFQFDFCNSHIPHSSRVESQSVSVVSGIWIWALFDRDPRPCLFSSFFSAFYMPKFVPLESSPCHIIPFLFKGICPQIHTIVTCKPSTRGTF